MGNEKSRPHDGQVEPKRERTATADTSPAKPALRSCITAAQFQLRMQAHHGIMPGAVTVAFDPVHRLLAVGTMQGEVKLFGREGVELVVQQREPGEPASPITFLVFVPSQERLVCVSGNSAVRIWDMRTLRLVGELKHTYARWALGARASATRTCLTCCAAPVASCRWTTCRISAAFFPAHSKNQFLYLATDNGVIHVRRAAVLPRGRSTRCQSLMRARTRRSSMPMH